jgi:hypothetical protein
MGSEPITRVAATGDHFAMYCEDIAATVMVRADASSRIVSVYRVRIGNSYAACSCGWSARRRTLKALACQDAWMHSARGECDVNVPLVRLLNAETEAMVVNARK